SSRRLYGDDAMRYVQLKCDGNIYTVKGEICQEHKVHMKLYAITLIVDEEEEVVTFVQCNDCFASEGGWKHYVALFMWIHRRSEVPPCTDVAFYRKNLSTVFTRLK
ncbi:hypothetical protein HHI36_004878, partial [Cryptolaemus montrouzieri]